MMMMAYTSSGRVSSVTILVKPAYGLRGTPIATVPVTEAKEGAAGERPNFVDGGLEVEVADVDSDEHRLRPVFKVRFKHRAPALNIEQRVAKRHVLHYNVI